MKIEARCAELPGGMMFSRDPARDIGISELRRPRAEAMSQGEFWDLLDPCRRKLYNFIAKSLGFSPEADDVYQDTVLRAFQYLASYRREDDFSSWIFAIAHNEIRRHRKSARMFVSGIDFEKVEAAPPPPDRDRAREVFRFAEGLKPRHKEVFFLFYDGGFKISEIAHVTGLREGNVKFILNRARTALKSILGESHERSEAG
jgi:RNA polymerase sigma-70 factor (ECF subfamily)